MDSAVPCLLRQIKSGLDSFFEENGAASKRTILNDYRPAYWFTADNTVADVSIPSSTQAISLGDNSRNKIVATATSNGSAKARIAHNVSYSGVAPIIIGDNQHFTLPSAIQISWAFAVIKDTNAGNNGKGMILSKSDSSQYWGMHQTGYPFPFSSGVGAADSIIGLKRTVTHGHLGLYSLKNRYRHYTILNTPGKIFSLGLDGYETLVGGANAEFTPDVMFGFASTGFDPNVHFLEIIAGDTRLSEYELLGIELYLANKYSLTLNPGKRWIQTGDSINTTQGGVTPYLKQLFGLYTSIDGVIGATHDWNAYIMAVGGWNTENAIGIDTTFSLAKQNCEKNVFGLHIGSNNIANGDSVSNTTAQLEIMANRARNSGYDEIVCFPMFDRGVSVQSNKNALNTALLNMKNAKVFDRFLDPALIPDLCDDGASTSLVNFQDGVHPTDAGHLIMANAINTAFSDLW